MKRMIIALLFTLIGASIAHAQSLLKPHDRIVLIGDSITEMGVRNPYGFYNQLTNAAFQVAHDKDYTFIPLGFSGSTLENWNAMLRQSLKAPRYTNYRQPRHELGEVFSNRCDVVVVFLGMNNILCPTLSIDPATHVQWQDTYRQFLTHLRERCHPRLFVLATITPLTADHESPKNIVRTHLNELAGALAKEFNGTVADFGKAIAQLQNETCLTDPVCRAVPDFVHPAAMGHTCMAHELCATLGDAALTQFFTAKKADEWLNFVTSRRNRLGYRFHMRRMCQADDDELVYDIDWRWNGDGVPRVALLPDKGWRVNVPAQIAKEGRFTITGKPTHTHNFVTFHVTNGQAKPYSLTFSIPVPWRVSAPFAFDAVWQHVKGQRVPNWQTNAVPPVAYADMWDWSLHTGNFDYTGDVERGSIDPFQMFFGAGADSFYAVRWVRVPDDRTLTAEIAHKTFSATYGVHAWVDERLVFTGVLNRYGHNTERFPVTLTKGWHRLLMRVDHCMWQRQVSFDLLNEKGKTPMDLEWAWRDPNPTNVPKKPQIAPLKAGERVVFLGDSLTHCGNYIAYLQLFQEMRHPHSGVRFDGAGWSGESIPHVYGRWPWYGRNFKPDRVIFMFGCNDLARSVWALREPTADTWKRRNWRLDQYRENLPKLLTFLSAEVPRVEAMTTFPFDAYCTVHNAEISHGFNDPGLKTAAVLVRDFATRANIGYVDTFAPMNDLYRAYPTRKLGGNDRVHPQGEGHLLATAAILDALGEGPCVATVQLNARTKSAHAERAAVSDVVLTPDSVSFTYAPQALPFPLLPEWQRDDEIAGLNRRFNRETLTVAGLDAGLWQLRFDGRAICAFTASQLAHGVNLALLDTPNARLALEAGQQMARMQTIEKDLRLIPMKSEIVRHFGGDPNDIASSLQAMDKLIADPKTTGWNLLTAKQYKQLRPREHELRAEAEACRKAMRVNPRTAHVELILQK